MTAYIIAEVSPHQSTPEYKELIQEYGLAAARTIKQYKGELLAKAPIETLCGSAKSAMKVIIMFPTSAKAIEWYNSTDYQALIPLRDKAMNCCFQLIEGK